MDLPDIDDIPLEMGYVPTTQLQIPPEMVISIAQGMDEPDSIAEKHGFTGERWEKLKAWPPFLAAVEAHKADLAASGYTFKAKAKFMAEELAEKTYVHAMGHDSTFAQRFQALQFFTRVGGLEPKEEKTASTGEGFSVTINMNGNQTTVSGNAHPLHDNTFDAQPSMSGGYMIAPLIDPSLFAEMATNQEAE